MSGHAETIHETSHGVTTRLFLIVWVTLVAITLVEVYLAYLHFPAVTMLLMLIGLSVLKAGLIMAYFMHLRFERFTLFLTLIPATIFCIGMMTVIFPDSHRLLEFRRMLQ
jgi:cytochrome c oxidase subunit IV